MTRYHIGLDAVNISRAGRLSDHFVERYFNPGEVEKVRALANGKRRAEYLASRFAAKEAYGKAVGRGLAGLGLDEIEVVTEPSGKPVMVLHGKTLECFQRDYPDGLIEVSITHEEPLALAVVMITYEEAGHGQD